MIFPPIVFEDITTQRLFLPIFAGHTFIKKKKDYGFTNILLALITGSIPHMKF